MAVAIAGPARAGSAFIVVTEQQPGERDADRVARQLRGELTADRIEVAPADLARPSGIASLARQTLAAGAAVGAELDVDADSSAIELTLVDPATGRTLRRSIQVDEQTERTAPEVLARRSVDLLRASLLDFLTESLRDALSRSAAAKTPEPPEAPRVDQRKAWIARIGLDAGVGALASFGGVGAALVPILRAGVSTDRRWQVRATAAWLGTRPSVDAAHGSATIDQGLALLELAASPWAGHALRPTGTLGIGTYWLRVSGVGAPPYSGTQSSAVALALSAGTGLAMRLATSLDISLEVAAIVTSPGLAVRFLGNDVAHIGRPSMLAAVTLGGWL